LRILHSSAGAEARLSKRLEIWKNVPNS